MNITLSEFLKAFPTPLHHNRPDSTSLSWIFWSGSENTSSSDLGTVNIHEMIMSVFSKMKGLGIIYQFWVPVTFRGRRLLTTSGQPFAFSHLDNELAMYRLYSEKYQYNIDKNMVEIEGDHTIISGGHVSAFLNRLPYANQLQWVTPKHCRIRLNFSVMLPICLPSQNRSDCIGVLEFTMDRRQYDLGKFLSHTITKVKASDLDVCNVQERIPYETIDCLKSAKDEIKKALKTVCESHNLALAQVWIAYEDISTMSFSSFMEDTCTKRLLACKFTGYLYEDSCDFRSFLSYNTYCDVIPHGNREAFVLKTLEDYESRYISKLGLDMIDCEDNYSENSALIICLRSIDTGDFDFVFEFIWREHSNFVILLEALLLTLKSCLPGFKFVSGAELDDRLHVIYVDIENGSHHFKIFQEKRSSPILKVLEDRQKRKFEELGMLEWREPNFVKKATNDSSIIPVYTKGDNGAIQDPSTVNVTKITFTLKVEYEDDIIKFILPISRATFVDVAKEIGVKLKLSVGTYKLKYLDKDGGWISLTSNEEMSDCIKSSRKSDQIVVRLRVLPSPKPISEPNGSIGM